jgi:hypothetical protein
MAVLTSRLPEVENRVSFLLALVQRAHMGTDNTRLRDHLRVALGCEAQPSAGMLESQSGQTTGGVRGYEGAKKIKGRKRHLLVDTQGLVLTVKVHPADVMDRDGVLLLLPPEQTTAQFPRLAPVCLMQATMARGRAKTGLKRREAGRPKPCGRHPDVSSSARRGSPLLVRLLQCFRGGG